MQNHMKDSADTLRTLENNFRDLIASIPNKQPLSEKFTDLVGTSSVANFVALANAGYPRCKSSTPGQPGTG
jgi:hypothetical protein